MSDKHLWFRSLLVGMTSAVWGWCVLFGVAVLLTVPLSEVVSISSTAGLVLRVENLAPALALAMHPLAWTALGMFLVAAVVVERRLNTSAGFARGALVGVLGVLGTAGLSAAVLLLGATEEVASMGRYATALFLAHLPLALIEGLIVGCIVAFLWRVKPQMLQAKLDMRAAGLLALLALPLCASTARAHALEVEYAIDRQKREVTVKCAYETGDAPTVATVRVFNIESKIIAEGETDSKGQFVFRYDIPQDLLIHVKEGGHVARTPIPMAELMTPTAMTTKEGSRLRDLLAGVGLLLGAAALLLAWRNSVRVSRLEERARTENMQVRNE